MTQEAKLQKHMSLEKSLKFQVNPINISCQSQVPLVNEHYVLN